MFQAICGCCGQRNNIIFYNLESQRKCQWCGAVCYGWLHEINGPQGFCIYPRVNLFRVYYNDSYVSEEGVVTRDEGYKLISITFYEDDKSYFVSPNGVMLNGKVITEATRMYEGDKLSFGGNTKFSLIAMSDPKIQEAECKPVHNPNLVRCEKCGNYYDGKAWDKCPTCGGMDPFGKTDKPRPYEDPMAPCV
ncbi:MAG: hypothetical protein LUC38_06140 [Oscillospiraceae bacterium]|nr:hypothetical protein [Ruminococcus sp.]MCD8345524.1 hypothetical protein [Oscillospiraceae bacterium]